jgi:hypothetical protein
MARRLIAKVLWQSILRLFLELDFLSKNRSALVSELQSNPQHR